MVPTDIPHTWGSPKPLQKQEEITMGKSTTRPHEIHLRLNEEEYQTLETNRKKCNLPQQTYLRKLCCGIRPNEFPPVAYFEILKLLGEINCNLTHLALRTKSGEAINAEMFWKSRDLIEVAVHELLMQFYGKQEEFDGEHLQ